MGLPMLRCRYSGVVKQVCAVCGWQVTITRMLGRQGLVCRVLVLFFIPMDKIPVPGAWVKILDPQYLYIYIHTCLIYIYIYIYICIFGDSNIQIYIIVSHSLSLSFSLSLSSLLKYVQYSLCFFSASVKGFDPSCPKKMHQLRWQQAALGGELFTTYERLKLYGPDVRRAEEGANDKRWLGR